jgi:uroporphyrinogen-III synthase
MADFISILIAFAAGVTVRHFWSYLRPWLRQEAHVVVSVAGKDAAKVLDAIKHKLAR